MSDASDPAPFTAADFSRRMVRATRQAEAAGLTGILVAPGIYLPGRFGVRIEDIVTVTSDGGRRLNNTSRELRIVS